MLHRNHLFNYQKNQYLTAIQAAVVIYKYKNQISLTLLPLHMPQSYEFPEIWPQFIVSQVTTIHCTLILMLQLQLDSTNQFCMECVHLEFCAKEIVKLFFNNDPSVVTQIQARFTQPVYPGQILP